MATLKVNVDVDASEPIRALDRLHAALTPPGITEVAAHGAEELVTAAKLTAPKDTGALARSIDKTQTGDSSFEVGPSGGHWQPGGDIPYARIQELGGDIYPKHSFTDRAGVQRLGFLRFEIGAATIYTRHVRMPAQHYMRNAFDVGREAAVGAVKQAIDRAIEG